MKVNHTQYPIRNTRYGCSSSRKGFTLVEALVAISILLVGILSAFSLVAKSLASAPVIRDRLVASFLAQEKLEEIRQIRDSNFLKILNGVNTTWTAGIESLSGTSDTVSLNNVDFTRNVTVKKISSDHLAIDCKVSWKTKGHPYHFVTEDHLFNWINIK